MTHGEEPGPETHTDSAVLTYLEGLLMHPVAAAGPGATATRRSEAAHGNQEQVNKVANHHHQPFQLPAHGAPAAAPKPVNNGPLLGAASQHLKKARLLCSGAWNQQQPGGGGQRLGSPPAELNGQGGGGGAERGLLQNGALDGSPHGGESTLLASLLQSFSSRLQSVAMSQQQTNNKAADQQQRSPPPLHDAPPSSSSSSAAALSEALPCYGTSASSRLKGLMRKSKLQNHSATPYSRRGHAPHQETSRPLSESPRSAHSATPPSSSSSSSSSANNPSAADAVSCAERLKAVANLVKIRSSPAPSPKPSVACSQLALLLSSEAHLQQYSREHALKATQLVSGRSASERLVAMATQQGQDKRPPSAGGEPAAAATPSGGPDALSSLTAQNGTPAATTTTTLPRPAPVRNSSQRSPSLLRAENSPRPLPASPPSQPQPHPQTPTTPHRQTPNTPHHHPHPLSLSQAHCNSQYPKEKRGLDASRPSRPPQTCSSLLLLLLNNHNNQKQLTTKNGHLEDDCGVLLPPSRGSSSSVTSDSECSVQERSLVKESSDAESSCYSSCSPIDLSVRGRAVAAAAHTAAARPKSTSTAFSSSASSISPATFSHVTRTAFSPPSCTIHHTSTPVFSSSSTSATTFSSSSSSSCLDKLTESMINKWKPDPSSGPPKVPQAKELETSPDLKSHPKVTLMQLLLERRNNDNKVNKMAANPDLPHDVTPMGSGVFSRGPPPKSSSPWEEGRTHSPMDRPGLPAPPPPSLYSLGREQVSTPSPYTSYPSPHVIQSSPLDLCKSKPSYPAESKPSYPAEKASEPAFSASKLLQNLAQCGSSGSPSPPGGKDLNPELDAMGRPLTLLERLNAPVQRNATPLSDGPSGSGTPAFGRRGEASPPSSSSIENLLERRTVLQLLLGTGSAAPASTTVAAGLRDRSSHGGGSGRRSVEGASGAGVCFEKPQGAPVICDSSNGPSAADVKVKIEPAEEELSVSAAAAAPAAVSEDVVSSRKRRGGGGGGYERRDERPFSDPQQDLKTEPRPAEVIAKYGLLSQLLKQQTATYYTSSSQTSQPRPPGPVKEEQREYQGGPSPPKKKRLCPALAESLNNGSPAQRAGADRGGSSSSSSLAFVPPQEGHDQRAVKEEEPLARSPPHCQAPLPLARSPPHCQAPLPRESRGFNVLKQLLLSDNCLKELSQQPRGSPGSPSVLQANGSVVNQPGYNHELLHLPWHHTSPHGAGSLGSGPSPLLPGHLRPLLSPPTPGGDGSHQHHHHHRSPWGRHPRPAPSPCQDSTKRDLPPPPPPPAAPVKREMESPVLWGGRGGGGGGAEEEEQGCDSSPDSPRLTRSNPILYYMLQKGSAQLRREMMRDQGEGMAGPPQGGAGGGAGGVRVKEEPVSDMHAYDHRLSSTLHSSSPPPPPPPPHNDKHSHSSRRLSQSSDKW